MEYYLSLIENFRAKGASWNEGLEYEAAWELVSVGWNWEPVEETARKGLSAWDLDTLRDWCAANSHIRSTPEKLGEFIVAECRRRVVEKLEFAADGDEHEHEEGGARG